MVDLRLWSGEAKTKSMRHCPQCGGDVYVLAWGVLTPQAMVGVRESLVLMNCELRNINSTSLKTSACALYSHIHSETKKN